MPSQPMPTSGNKTRSTAIMFAVFSILLLVLSVYYVMTNPSFNRGNIPGTPDRGMETEEKVVAFSSVEEFQSYIKDADARAGTSGGISTFSMRGAVPLMTEDSRGKMAPFSAGGGTSYVDRYSTTNVQVSGIDEPDMVKTNGKQLFISNNQYNYYMPIMTEPAVMQKEIFTPEQSIGSDRIAPNIYYPVPEKPKTTIVDALPPESMIKTGVIEEQGDLLLVNKTLVVFAARSIVGYDVSNPALPVKVWNIDYDDMQSYHTARLFGDTLYLVTTAGINRESPCPYIPLRGTVSDMTIRCEDIYHPISPIPSDSTYTITSVNTQSGQMTDSVSFVGSSGSSVISMSPNAIYVAYSYYKQYADVYAGFYSEEGDGMLPKDVMSRIKKVQSYELSAAAEQVEIDSILASYRSTLTSDEARKFETESANRMQAYISRHIRDFESTGIVKISRDDLRIESTGRVPGHPLNQFAIDEFDGNVRIATTMTGGFFSGRNDSVSDVYVLDDGMDVVGRVENLGKGERIYAVRFIRDAGYVVTFKQTDPFYVLDLSRPAKPQLKGELKIPGYSSYLHPLTDTMILGVGKEDQQVKLSLFDVSDPTDPVEADKYSLDEYWTDVENTHHAFLQDPKFETFFIPGSEGGYVFSYAGSRLVLESAISTVQPKRAVFINDFLYIIGDAEIVVINERTGNRVGRLSL